MTLRLTYYGDDFTGSTDAMEGLATAGIRTVLFVDPPDSIALQQFRDIAAVGVAGVSRAMSPEWMDRELPSIFEALHKLGAPITHYKVCSTFDSSPRVGSIGRALEIGQHVLAPQFVPIVVGQPRLGRYCSFGNLFARSGEDSPVFRLDRHPTMRHHPSTPMLESDLRLHLARQTSRSVALFDAADLECSREVRQQRFKELLRDRPDAILFDVMREAHLPIIGDILDQYSPSFAVGSSAVEYALAMHWRERGEVSGFPAYAPNPTDENTGPLIVVSGSCSPVTARQIAFARDHGFCEVALRPEVTADAEVARAIDISRDALTAGRSVVVHTCQGPDDPRRAPVDDAGSAHVFGSILGSILATVLRETGVRRAVVAGGDTSGHVVRALGILALEMAAPTTPGAPVCRAYASDALDGVQLVLKGGQVGLDSFFVELVSSRDRRPDSRGHGRGSLLSGCSDPVRDDATRHQPGRRLERPVHRKRPG